MDRENRKRERNECARGICIYQKPPPRTECDTRSVFSFFSSGCRTKAKTHLPYHFPFGRRRTDGSMLYSFGISVN